VQAAPSARSSESTRYQKREITRRATAGKRLDEPADRYISRIAGLG